MGQSTTLTIRLDKGIKDRLEISAQHQKRSKSFLAVEAIEHYLDIQQWQEQRIREALASADRGEGVPHGKVMAWISSWGNDDELPIPKA